MMSTTWGRILSRIRCTTASTRAGSGAADSDGLVEAGGLGEAAGLRDPAGFGECRGLTAAGCEITCLGAATWAEGTGIEAACCVTISLALAFKLSVISAHIFMGTDRAVSSGSCGACGLILALASLALGAFGSTAGSESAQGSTASLVLAASAVRSAHPAAFSVMDSER